MADYFLSFWLHYPHLTAVLPAPVLDCQISDRWTLSAAWPTLCIGVEFLPSYLTPDGQTLPQNVETICQKQNAALLAGWQVFWLTGSLLNAHPRHCIETIAKAVGGSLTHAH